MADSEGQAATCCRSCNSIATKCANCNPDPLIIRSSLSYIVASGIEFNFNCTFLYGHSCNRVATKLREHKEYLILSPQPGVSGSSLSTSGLDADYRDAALPALAGRKVRVAVSSKYRPWTRRLHAILGLISAFNLALLISSGFLLQHRELLRLDERNVSRRILPSSYRPEDPGLRVRADIVVTDLHSGRLFGTAGTMLLDAVTLVWLVMLATGLAMYISGARSNRSSRSLPEDEE
jgi:hypothetical protein